MKRFVLLLAIALTGIACGCGSGGLAASSSCQDFSNASPEEQAEAISKLASQFNAPDYTTPLGRPEVGYYCAANPDTTLEEFFQQAGEE